MSSLKTPMDFRVIPKSDIKQNKIAIVPVGLGDLFIIRLLYDSYPEINDFIVVNLRSV